MPDYSKAKIYKITSPHTNEIYIGSTIQLLTKRKASHVSKFKNHILGKYPYTTSFKLIELGDIDICLLEEYPCENKEQLHARERYYVDNNACVNKDKSYRTNPDYKERCIQVLNDKYYVSTKEHKLEQDRIRNKIKMICECGATINKQHHIRHEKSKKHIDAMN